MTCAGKTERQLVVGVHAVEAVLRSDPSRVSCLLCSDVRRDKRLTSLLALAKNQGVEIRTMTRDELTSLCGHSKHQSVIARYLGTPDRTENHLLGDLTSDPAPWLILILDEVQDPHNLGACLRSADAAGVNAVVIPRDNAVGITPVVQKVAAGAAATVRLYRVTNLARTIRQLQESGVWVYGAAGESTVPLYQLDLTGSVALVLGAEGSGMRKLTKNSCDQLYQIPLYGQVESLNVSVAAGISLFEARRQRETIDKPAKIR